MRSLPDKQKSAKFAAHAAVEEQSDGVLQRPNSATMPVLAALVKMVVLSPNLRKKREEAFVE